MDGDDFVDDDDDDWIEIDSSEKSLVIFSRKLLPREIVPIVVWKNP